MGRAPCCDKANVKKGPWAPEEDAKLKEYIEKHGTGGNWIALPQKVGLKRCGKSCRLRWLNYLRPNIKHGEFSDEEDRIICTLFANIGSRWSIIAAQLPGRTDNDIKNYWNTKLKKKLMGFVHSNNPSYHNNINIIPHKNNINNNINNNKFLVNPPFQNSSLDAHHQTNITDHRSSSLLSHHHQQQPLVISSSLSGYSSSNHYCTAMMSTTSESTNLINFQGNHHQDHQISLVGGVTDWGGQYNINTANSGINNNNNNNNLLMFGTSNAATNDQGSCSTSSEGSCNYQNMVKQEEIMINGFHRHQTHHQTSFVGLLSNNINDYGHIGDDNEMLGQRPSGCFGGAVLDDQDRDYQYSSSPCVVEDVKQVISANYSGSGNNFVGSNNYFMSFFNVDENKTQENNKVMYF